MGRFSRLETTAKSETAQAGRLTGRVQTWAELPATPDAEGSALEDADAAGSLRQGDIAFFSGDSKKGLRLYSRAIDKDSRLLEAWVSLVRALLLTGDLHAAHTWIGRGLTVFPNSPALMGLRAVSYARRGMLRQAMNNSDAVLEQNPNESLAHIARGEVLLLADNKNADHCFEQAIRIAPEKDWKTPFVIGLIHERERLWARAIVFYAKAAERNDRLPSLWYHVGLCRAELGQGQLAEKAYEQAAAVCPPGDPLLARLEHAKRGSVWRLVKSVFRRK